MATPLVLWGSCNAAMTRQKSDRKRELMSIKTMNTLSGLLGAICLLVFLASLGSWMGGFIEAFPGLAVFFAVLCGLLSAEMYRRSRGSSAEP